MDDNSRLKRSIHEIPDYVMEALEKDDLVDRYNKRPPYQRNDYIGWITRAKLSATRMKRLKQMLDELRSGDKYMKMAYKAKR